MPRLRAILLAYTTNRAEKVYGSALLNHTSLVESPVKSRGTLKAVLFTH